MSSSSTSASSPPFTMSEAPLSSSPSSPPPPEDPSAKAEEMEAREEEKETDERFKRLQFVLEKSALYSRILKERMDEDKATQLFESSKSREDSLSQSPSKRRKGVDGKAVTSEDENPIFKQPSLISGAKLKSYQLEGLQWMVSLHQNGISGILADEMGLGKTLQTIAFSAYLREVGVTQPFMVVCPLSVLHNWQAEYKKFAPSIPVCVYHGSPSEREELRRGVLRRSSAKLNPKPRGRKSKGFKRKVTKKDEDEGVSDMMPIVITTYEIIIRDRTHLAEYNWGYIVVDEGHRLKNLDCKLMREIKKYSSASRMILTGTPLHNNLSELWSLLNFVLPDIFNDIDSFQEWFNLPTMQMSLGSDRSSSIIDALHAILKPFLLRRLKVDVETNLPPKKEYVLYAPLTEVQKEAYNSAVEGTLRSYLLGHNSLKEKAKDVDVAENGPMKLRKRASRKSYAVDGDDDEYFEMLEKEEVDERGVKPSETLFDLEAQNKEHQRVASRKQVNNMKLQNTVMQLRKICSHPYLFDWPVDPATKEPILDDSIVNTSGKMMVLDRLLTELFERKHKVLLFSQFTTMLDIIHDWAREMKGWEICRIDGSTAPLDRREEMDRFQNGGDAPDAPQLFLLSTRAGGLGINLVAADTVIFYDQDWNPQMDAQAQDRAHRIGQTKPVLIFRLVSAHTIETKIMQKATEKRKLEALVIAKGKFRKPAAAAAARQGKSESMAETAAALLRLEGEKIDVVPSTKEGKASVLNDSDLDMLLDRRPEVFVDRRKGWTSAAYDGKMTDSDGKTAFAVYEAPANEGNDVLAKMLGEDIE